MKIFFSEKNYAGNFLAPSGIQTDSSLFLKISCADGFIDLKDVQLAGKRKMPVTELLRGFRVDNSWKIKPV